MGRAVTESATIDVSASRRARRRLLLASVVLAGWLAFLAHQAYWHSNPVVVFVPQVLVAPLIVEGELHEQPLRVRVERVWRGDPVLVGRELELAGTPPADAARGGRYVLLLRPLGERFQLEPAGDGQTVYPADDHVRRQLERILRPQSKGQ
jgi:hypothetical protein